MRFEVGVVSTFHATHALRGDFGAATRSHAHDYRVEAAVRGRDLRDDGTLVDIAQLEGALREALAEIEGRPLDASEAFRERNSTAENVAAHLAHRLRRSVCGQLVVRVWESAGAYASCELDDE